MSPESPRRGVPIEMSRSDWLERAIYVLGALVIGLFLGLIVAREGAVFGSDVVRGKEPLSAFADQASSSIKIECAELSGAEANKCAREIEQAAKNAQTAAEDLKAQREMANWARGMFWTTVASVVLTFAALLTIVRTLHHTRRAADASQEMVDEAKATTDAAQATARHAQRQLEFSERLGRIESASYLSFKSGFIRNRANTVNSSVTIENTGRSPAEQVRIIGFSASANGAEGTYILFSGEVNSDSISLAPGGVEQLKAIVQPEENTENENLWMIITEPLNLDVRIEVEWKDSLGNRHSVIFELSGSTEQGSLSLESHGAPIHIKRSIYKYLGYDAQIGS